MTLWDPDRGLSCGWVPRCLERGTATWPLLSTPSPDFLLWSLQALLGHHRPSLHGSLSLRWYRGCRSMEALGLCPAHVTLEDLQVIIISFHLDLTTSLQGRYVIIIISNK